MEQFHREFESHPLCIKPRLALLVLGFILGSGFELQQSLALFLSSSASINCLAGLEFPTPKRECILLSVLVGSFFVIVRAKARSNLARADFKLSEVKKSKLDENGLLLDSKIHITPP